MDDQRNKRYTDDSSLRRMQTDTYSSSARSRVGSDRPTTRRFKDDGSLRRMHAETSSITKRRRSSSRFWDTVLPKEPYAVEDNIIHRATPPPPSPSPPLAPPPPPVSQMSSPRTDSALLRHYSSQSFHVPSQSVPIVAPTWYQCEMCKVAFSHQSHLIHHLKTVHEAM